MAKNKTVLLELPVAFGNISIGDKTARVGVTISRGNLTPSKADKELCGKRLIGQIVAVPEGTQPENEPLPGMNGDISLAGAFDVKGFGVTSKHITLGLTFAIKSIKVEDLAHFAKRDGRIVVNETQALSEDDEDEEQ